MSNRIKYKLSEILELVGGGTPKTTVEEYWNGDIPWLSVVDFGNKGKYVYNTEKTITEKGLKESSTKILKKGSLIISARGTVGELAVLGRDMAFNQSCYGIVANNKATNDYLYYLLKLSVGKIKQNTHGAVFDTITKQTFENIEIEISESKKEQSRIASILSCLDDKIELNLQMNQTLENMAQAIFEEWCCFKPQQMSSNWSLMKLSDLAEVTSSKRIFMDEYTDNGVPFYRGKEITQLSKGEKISTELFISDERYFDIKSKYGIPKIGDILITSVGTIGSIWIVDTELPFYFKDGNVTWVRGYKTIVTGQYIYQWLKTKDAQEQIKSLTIGSTQQALTISALKNLDIRIPDDSIVAKTIVELQAIYNKRQFNLNQIQTLTLIRDNLLPKLMTGKIEIKN